MANFAERIAYWYLRLNGFFLIENFVHHARPGERRASDLDVLAIRLRHAYEAIEGEAVELDGLGRAFRFRFGRARVGGDRPSEGRRRRPGTRVRGGSRRGCGAPESERSTRRNPTP